MSDTRQLHFDLDDPRSPEPTSGSQGVVPSKRRAGVTGRRRGAPSVFEPEAAARLLEAHGDYQVLRRLQPRPVSGVRSLAANERVAVIVDTETTGLDHRHDEVIEIGAVSFIHDADGAVLEVIGVFSALQEPTRPLSSEITRLTGITDAMVAGQRIDVDALEAFIEAADLVIAHNAGFDRPFCERLARGFDPKPWACSVKEVDWALHGYEGTKLGYLVGQSGLFHNGHRATDDCHALLEVLALALPGQERTALGHLAGPLGGNPSADLGRGRALRAEDQLKRRGYRWDGGGDGRPKAWWTEVDEAQAAAEVTFLESEIYMRRVRPRTQHITACERYKAS